MDVRHLAVVNRDFIALSPKVVVVISEDQLAASARSTSFLSMT
jgi:hypothetical protein